MPTNTDKQNDIISGGAMVGGILAFALTGGALPAILYGVGAGIFTGAAAGVSTRNTKNEDGKILFHQQRYYEALLAFEEAASLGHYEAVRNIGALFENGYPGVPQNVLRARNEYRRALTNGYMEAQIDLNRLADFNYLGAQLHADGDFLGAERAFKNAAILGDSMAIRNRGLLYEVGQPHFPQNLLRARELYQLAIAGGYALAAVDIERLNTNAEQRLATGRRYEEIDFAIRNVCRALEIYRQVRASGYQPAQAAIDNWHVHANDYLRRGEEYQRERNIVLARENYLRASEYRLAAANDKITEFDNMAVTLLREAAIHESCDKKERDDVQAVKKYIQAKEYGSDTAEVHLNRLFAIVTDPSDLFAIGSLYYHGAGINKDYQQALTWLTKAKKHRSIEACKLIAGMYEDENMLGVNDKLATENRKAAAELEAKQPQPKQVQEEIQYLPHKNRAEISKKMSDKYTPSQVTFLMPCCIGYSNTNQFKFLESCLQQAFKDKYKTSLFLGPKDEESLKEWHRELAGCKADPKSLFNRLDEDCYINRSHWREKQVWLDAKVCFDEFYEQFKADFEEYLCEDVEAHKNRSNQEKVLKNASDEELAEWEEKARKHILDEVVDYLSWVQTKESRKNGSALTIILNQYPLYKCIAHALKVCALMKLKFVEDSFLCLTVDLFKKPEKNVTSVSSSSATLYSSTNSQPRSCSSNEVPRQKM